MVLRGVNLFNLWCVTVHICKVLHPGYRCLIGQSPFCLNKLSYGFTWTRLLKPLLHFVYPYYMDASHQLTGQDPGHGWPYCSACTLCILLTIITSVPWNMERVLCSWPCYELHSSVSSFEEVWNAEGWTKATEKNCIYSYTRCTVFKQWRLYNMLLMRSVQVLLQVCSMILEQPGQLGRVKYLHMLVLDGTF